MKVFSGQVIKVSGINATVSVLSYIVYPKYNCKVKKFTKFYVHNDLGACVGDEVEFVETSPISATKKHKISAIKGVKR